MISQLAVLATSAHDVRMISQIGTILCVEADDSIVTGRCKALELAGYTAVSASPMEAIDILADRTFNFIVVSGISNTELDKIMDVADGAEILTLDGTTPSTVLLFLVDERLRQLRQRKA